MYDPINDLISLRTQSLAVIGGVGLLSIIIYLVRKEQLREGYSILWLATGAIFFITSLFSGILFWISDVVGIFYAPATLFLLLLIGLLLITIHYSIVLSKHERRIKELAQEIALLKGQTKKLKKK